MHKLHKCMNETITQQIETIDNLDDLISCRYANFIIIMLNLHCNYEEFNLNSLLDVCVCVHYTAYSRLRETLSLSDEAHYKRC